MKSDVRLNLKYTKAFPIFLFLCCFVIFWATFVIGPSSSTITGLVLLPIAILTLIKDVIVITPRSIEWSNMLGRVVKRIEVQPGEITLEGNKVCVKGEKQFRLWLFDKNVSQVESFINSLQN